LAKRADNFRGIVLLNVLVENRLVSGSRFHFDQRASRTQSHAAYGLDVRMVSFPVGDFAFQAIDETLGPR
jgi:hypothetical protein